MTTTVTHVRFLQKGWWDDPQYIYIGGKTSKYGQQGMAGVWRCPIYVPQDADNEQRELILRDYNLFLEEACHDPLFRRSVRQLSGKILVGFDHPKLGHGNTLAILADRLQADAEQWQQSLERSKVPDLAELEYRERCRKREIIHRELDLVFREWKETTTRIVGDNTGRTGMPDWFRRWKDDHLKPVLEKDRELFPESYRAVREKTKFNYDRDIPEFYAFPQGDVYDE